MKKTFFLVVFCTYSMVLHSQPEASLIISKKYMQDTTAYKYKNPEKFLFRNYIIKSFDNMPCIRPKGLFSMRIVKPDTTVYYTLRIKKLQQDRNYYLQNKK